MHISSVQGSVNLQATLSASSAMSEDQPRPHHPITCNSMLWLHEDGRLECEHAVAPSDDVRTQFCLDQSIAMLLMELAWRSL